MSKGDFGKHFGIQKFLRDENYRQPCVLSLVSKLLILDVIF